MSGVDGVMFEHWSTEKQTNGHHERIRNLDPLTRKHRPLQIPRARDREDEGKGHRVHIAILAPDYLKEHPEERTQRVYDPEVDEDGSDYAVADADVEPQASDFEVMGPDDIGVLPDELNDADDESEDVDKEEMEGDFVDQIDDDDFEDIAVDHWLTLGLEPDGDGKHTKYLTMQVPASTHIFSYST